MQETWVSFKPIFWVYNWDVKNGTNKITAKSVLAIADGILLDPVMYTSADFSTVLTDTIAELPEMAVSYDAQGLPHTPLIGYFPEQTLRQRLQWLCAIGDLQLLFQFDRGVRITKIEDVFNTYDKIVYKEPAMVHNKESRDVIVYYYEYTQETPASGQDYIEVNGTYYTYVKDSITMYAQYDNFNAPLTLDIPIMSQSAISTIDRLDEIYYEANSEIKFSVLCTGRLPYPGCPICVKVSNGDIYFGKAGHCEYETGKSGIKVTITMPYALESSLISSNWSISVLTINRKYGNIIIESEQRPYAKITANSMTEIIVNENIEKYNNGVISFYVPQNPTYNYSVRNSDYTVTMNYDRAYQHDGYELYLERVDDLSLSNGVMSIE